MAKNKWLWRIVLFFALWITLHVSYIVIDGLHDTTANADVALIEGNAVFADGSLAPRTKGRVDKALELYRTGKVKRIYASGGIFYGPDERGYPEGKAMKGYLVAHGVPDSAVIADNYGQNTYLGSKDFMAWNASHHYTSVIVVTQFYHITRSKYILRKLGFKQVGNAASTVYTWGDVTATLREVPAFYKYMIVY